MRDELATAQRDLEASRVIRSELALELANATSDGKLAKERLESEQLRATELITTLEKKEQAIATLTTENQNLKEHLENLAKVEEPTPPPENLEEQTPAVTVETETEPKTKKVDRAGLVDYILARESDPAVKNKIKKQTITDAVRDKHRNARGETEPRLSLLIKKYDFEFVEELNGKYYFLIPE